MTYKILLPQEIMAEGRAYLESRGYQLIKGSGMEEEDIIRDIGDCDGIIVRLSKMSDRVFEAAKKLKARFKAYLRLCYGSLWTCQFKKRAQ